MKSLWWSSCLSRIAMQSCSLCDMTEMPKELCSCVRTRIKPACILPVLLKESNNLVALLGASMFLGDSLNWTEAVYLRLDTISSWISSIVQFDLAPCAICIAHITLFLQ